MRALLSELFLSRIKHFQSGGTADAFIYIWIKATVCFPPQYVSIIQHKWKMQLSKPSHLTAKLCENNSSSIWSVFPLVSKFCFSRSAQACFWWRETIKALQGLKGSTKKNVFSLRMNCIDSRRLRSFLLLLRYKMQIVNQVWWLIKEGQRKKSLGGERCCTFNYTIKIFRCFLWNEGWRSKEIKELKAAAFRASQNVQTWRWACLRGRKCTFLLVCSIITHLERQLNVWLLPDVTAYQMLMQYLPGPVGGGVLRTFSQQRY